MLSKEFLEKNFLKMMLWKKIQNMRQNMRITNKLRKECVPMKGKRLFFTIPFLIILIAISIPSQVSAYTMSNYSTWGYTTLYSGQYPYFFQEYTLYTEDYNYTSDKIEFGNRRSYIAIINGKNLPFGSNSFTSPYTQYYANNQLQGTASNFYGSSLFLMGFKKMNRIIENHSLQLFHSFSHQK